MQNAKKCPVCDWDINDGGIKVQVGGKEITVCCDDCAKKVEESPATYAGATK
jgi:ribosome-binding protein aMBF1 (putative translation factor)